MYIVSTFHIFIIIDIDRELRFSDPDFFIRSALIAFEFELCFTANDIFRFHDFHLTLCKFRSVGPTVKPKHLFQALADRFFFGETGVFEKNISFIEIFALELNVFIIIHEILP